MPVTYKNLYDAVIDFDNLLEAYSRARRGKQQTDEMRRFQFNLEMNLWNLHAELKDGTYQPGLYRHFRIVDPKPRKISAAPFRDRIVHHALCLIIQPLFERKFIFDSYANRAGKGGTQSPRPCRGMGTTLSLRPQDGHSEVLSQCRSRSAAKSVAADDRL